MSRNKPNVKGVVHVGSRIYMDVSIWIYNKMCLQNEIPKKQRNLGSVNISYSVNRELGGNQIQY